MHRSSLELALLADLLTELGKDLVVNHDMYSACSQPFSRRRIVENPHFVLGRSYKLTSLLLDRVSANQIMPSAE